MTAARVAFFRNLNVGQRRSPTRDQLLDAFAAEGATHVLSHQSNGTVAFAAAGDPLEVADAMASRLPSVCEWSDVVIVRSVDWLADLGLDARTHRPLPGGSAHPVQRYRTVRS